MSEIKKAVVVVVLIFIKHNVLCGRLADSNYFCTEESIPCTNFCVRETPFACTVVIVHAICEGLINPKHNIDKYFQYAVTIALNNKFKN